MAAFISMLRGINVGGAKKMPMADLKAMVESLGFQQVITYLQSGNVVFDGGDTGLAAREEIASRLEAAIEQAFGFSLPVFVRVAADFQRIVDSNPFLKQKQADPSFFHVTFLYTAPDPALLARLAVPPGETAEFILGREEIFLHCPDGYGRTKLSNQFFESRLKVPATTRNWNTVLALLELAGRGKS